MPEGTVAIMGSTGRGNYGHGIDTAWLDFPEMKIVGVADDDAKGLEDARKRLGGPPGFRDYREMLRAVKPEFVSVCPRWVDQHRDMALAAVEAGARGIFMEKPMCRTLAEADEIVAACEKRGVKLALAYQTRYSPTLTKIRGMVEGGKIGQVLEVHARGKDDQRGGAEDLWVLGSHVLNVMHHLLGEPRWCSAMIHQGEELVTKKHARPGNEGIGLLAGDRLAATYGFDGGIVGHFHSRANAAGNPSRFGAALHGSEGVIQMSFGYHPDAYWLPDGSWQPGKTGKTWQAISTPTKEERDGQLGAGNRAILRDLIAAVERDHQPEASVYEARLSTEMIVAVFASHARQKPVRFPLTDRQDPLASLGEVLPT